MDAMAGHEKFMAFHAFFIGFVICVREIYMIIGQNRTDAG